MVAAVKPRLSLDARSFEKNCRAAEQELLSRRDQVMRGAATRFANYASVRTPPEIGRDALSTADRPSRERAFAPEALLPGSLYRRRIVLLRQHVRSAGPGGRYKRVFGEKLQQGYEYAVIVDRPKQRKELRYFKSEGEAKQAAQIHYRGLARAAWGMNLPRDLGGQRVPALIAPLLRQAKALKKQRGLNRSTLTATPRQVVVTVSNAMTLRQVNWAAGAIANGERQARRHIEENLSRALQKPVQL